MLAYHNDVKIKEDILKQLQAHYKADEIVKGIYWGNGKGCAVGCTLHSGNNEEYETRFGIPTQLAYLEERIFEFLPGYLAKEWPIRFMNSINVGADLFKVWPKFAIWLFSDQEYGVIKYAKDEKTTKYIKNVIDLYQKSLTEHVNIEKFKYASEALSNTYYPTFTIISVYDAVDPYGVSAAAADAYATQYGANASCRSKQKHYIAQSETLIEIIKNTF